MKNTEQHQCVYFISEFNLSEYSIQNENFALGHIKHSLLSVSNFHPDILCIISFCLHLLYLPEFEPLKYGSLCSLILSPPSL